ncbi:MAG TPA: hypothetical protein ACFYD3_09925 [Candidatus Hypogeohydataceae bacterium YC41]
MIDVSKWVNKHYDGSGHPGIDQYAIKVVTTFIHRLPPKVWEDICNGRPRLRFYVPKYKNISDYPGNSMCRGTTNGTYIIKLGARIVGDPTIQGGTPKPHTPIDEVSLAIVSHEVAHAVLGHDCIIPPGRFVEYDYKEIEADALAVSWGFKVREWLEELRHGAAFNLGLERWEGDPVPPVELNDCSKIIEEEHLEGYQKRIQALEKLQPENRP